MKFFEQVKTILLTCLIVATTAYAIDKIPVGNPNGTSLFSGDVEITSGNSLKVNSISNIAGDGNPTFQSPLVPDPLPIDTINESTTDNGVTVDGVLLKDGVVSTSGAIRFSSLGMVMVSKTCGGGFCNVSCPSPQTVAISGGCRVSTGQTFSYCIGYPSDTTFPKTGWQGYSTPGVSLTMHAYCIQP